MLKHMVLLLFIASLPIGISLTAEAQDNDLPPYLYYYSDVVNAFVIERADGSDSRLFANGIMPPETRSVIGAGWSPSGEWFAWGSTDNAFGTDQYGGSSVVGDYTPWIISTDGTQLLGIIDGMPNTVRMSWSPVNDTLLVIDRPTSRNEYVVYLIDVQEQQVVISYELNGAFPTFINWSPDGESVSIQSSDILHTLSIAGETIEQETNSIDHSLYWYGDPYTNNDHYAILPNRTGLPQGYEITDKTTQESAIIRSHSGGYWWGVLNEVDWHPSAPWLITYQFATNNTIYAFTAVANTDGTVRRDLGGCVYSAGCAGWLPEQVAVDSLPAGNPTSVIPSPQVIVSHNDMLGWVWSNGLWWSPDAENLAVAGYVSDRYDHRALAVVWQQDNDGFNQVYSREIDFHFSWIQEEDTYTLVSDEDGTAIELLGYLPFGPVFSPDGQTYVNYTEGDILGVYDANTDEVLHVMAPFHTLFQLPRNCSPCFPVIESVTYSPDGRIIAASAPGVRVHIWDAATGELITVLNVYSNAVAFSPDGHWLATGMATDVALWDMTPYMQTNP